MNKKATKHDDFPNAFRQSKKTQKGGNPLDESRALEWVRAAGGREVVDWSAEGQFHVLGEQDVCRQGEITVEEFGATLAPLALAVWLGLPRTVGALLAAGADPRQPIRLMNQAGDEIGEISAIAIAIGWSMGSPQETLDCLGPLKAAAERLERLEAAQAEAAHLVSAMAEKNPEAQSSGDAAPKPAKQPPRL